MQKITYASSDSKEKVLEEVIKFIKNNKKPVIIITGPTSSGKTDLAHFLNLNISSLLINADSRQIYKEINKGSNKPEIYSHIFMNGFDTSIVKENGKDIYYWMLDILNVKKEYSAQDFRLLVRNMIHTLRNLNRTPIIVGGTVHWLKSLITTSISPYYEKKPEIFNELDSSDLEYLQKKYREIYPDQNINESDWENKRRLIRAIEFYLVTKKSLYESTRNFHDENNYFVIQTVIDRVAHVEKVRKSIVLRIDNGWIEEVQNLLEKYDYSIFNKLGQGYRIIANYLREGKENKDELIEKILSAEMLYTKRQKL